MLHDGRPFSGVCPAPQQPAQYWTPSRRCHAVRQTNPSTAGRPVTHHPALSRCSWHMETLAGWRIQDEGRRERRWYPWSMPSISSSLRFDTVLREMALLQPHPQYNTTRPLDPPSMALQSSKPTLLDPLSATDTDPRCSPGVLPVVVLLAINGRTPSPSGPSREASVLVRFLAGGPPLLFP